MNKKYKIAMAVTLATTSIAYSIGGLFAQSESTISENNPIDTTGENTETEVLENKEGVQSVEKTVEDIEINEVNFPDAAFREYIRTGSDSNTKVRFDINGDGVLSSNEITNITGIYVNNNKNITSVEGIEHFPNLTYLDCGRTGITELDVSKNTALTALYCASTGITSLDVSNNIALKRLEFPSTGITSIDVSKNTGLTWLGCHLTGITELDVSKNTALEWLIFENTAITSIDVSKNTALTHLWCENAGITSLDVSKNTALYSLDISGTNLAWLNVGNSTNLGIVNTVDSTIHLGKMDRSFRIQELYPGMDLNKIKSISGASLDKATGIVSGYVEGTPITYTYDCGINRNLPVTLNVTLNFAIKDLSSIAIHDDLDKVYDGTAVADPTNITTIGSTGSVSFEWYEENGTKLQTAPTDAGSYKVKAILAEDTNYAGAEVEKEFEITKASSTVIINDNLNKIYDGTAVVEPTNITTTGSNGVVSFEWYAADGSKLQTAPTEAGSYKVKAILAGDGNHKDAEIEKEFVIGKASSTVTINDDLNKIYDGVAVVEPTNITTTGSNGAVSFEWYAADGSKLQTAPTEAGSYKVKATLAGDGNFNGAEVEKEFIIRKASSTIVIHDNLDKEYDGTAVVEPTNIIKTGSNGVVSFEWYTVSGTKLQTAPINAGSYKVKAILAENTNYAGAEVEKEFTITKANSTIAIHDNLDKEYDGTAVLNPANVSITGSSGIVSFEWYTISGVKLVDAPINGGIYKVKVILAGDTNYAGAEVEKTFEITKATNQWKQELSIQGWVYGETLNNPSVEAQFGTVEYTYSISEDGVYTTAIPSNAGTYWVKASVIDTDSYTGLEAKKAFTIEKASSMITITSDLNKGYDGQPVVEPQVSVIGSTGAITYEWYKKEESITKAVTWTKLATAPSEVGNYKVVVTVAEDENYEATTVEKEFSILDKEVVPTPGLGGVITNPDGTEGSVVNPGDTVESNRPVITNPDGSITFPNGGTIIRPDGSIVIIQPGATLKPNNLPVEGEGTTTIPGQVTGVQTGDSTQVGVWTMLVGLSTGMMMYFRRKNRKEEV